MERIIAYLCNEELGEITVTTPAEPPTAISTITRTEQVTEPARLGFVEKTFGSAVARVMPDTGESGCKPNVGKISVKLLNEVDNVYECDPGSDQLTWWRGEWPKTGYLDPEEEYLHDLHSWISFAFQNPELCQWIVSDITIFGAGGEMFHGRPFVIITVNSGDQACPEEKKDVFPAVGKTSSHSMIQNQIVPGERVRLEYVFSDTETQLKVLIDEKWFFTHCFTGGKVISVNGDYGNEDITYTVELEGLEKTCVPSDFVEYAVDDWVFVTKIGGECETCENRPGVSCHYSGVEPYAGSELLLAFVNRARSDEGLNPLILNPDLSRAAIRHAKDIAKNEFSSHTGSDGSTSYERIAATGYFAGGGATGSDENVAYKQTSVGLVFNSWMNSTEDKANILNTDFKDMGFGHEIHVTELLVTYDDEGNRIVTDSYETDYWCLTLGYNDSPPPTPVSDYVILPMKVAGYGP